jgi:ERCC4-related helicase
MNLSVLLKIAEYAGTALGVLAFALVTYWRMREKKMERERGLDSNPERCGQHEARLDKIEDRLREECDSNRDDHARIFTQLQAMAVEIAKLSRNGGWK